MAKISSNPNNSQVRSTSASAAGLTTTITRVSTSGVPARVRNNASDMRSAVEDYSKAAIKCRLLNLSNLTKVDNTKSVRDNSVKDLIKMIDDNLVDSDDLFELCYHNVENIQLAAKHKSIERINDGAEDSKLGELKIVHDRANTDIFAAIEKRLGILKQN